MAKFDEVKMEQGEDPQPYLNRIDEAVAMLNSLEAVKTDNKICRHIMRDLTKDYKIEQRTHFRKPNITRADIESRFGKVSRS